jgi:hypothetical protein
MALEHVTYFRVLTPETLQGTTTDGVGPCCLHSNVESRHQCRGKRSVECLEQALACIRMSLESVRLLVGVLASRRVVITGNMSKPTEATLCLSTVSWMQTMLTTRRRHSLRGKRRKHCWRHQHVTQNSRNEELSGLKHCGASFEMFNVPIEGPTNVNLF